MTFPLKIKEQALVACGRHCAICHKFCGIKIELHHIKQESEGGKNTFENCIPLCFDCHGDMKSYDHRHPKGTKFSRDELIRHRDHWYEKVNNPIVANYGPEQKAVDIKIYDKVTSTLPYDPVIKKFETVSFTSGDDADEFPSLLDNFLKIAWDPRNEFIDPELESFRSELASMANKLAWVSQIWKRKFARGAENIDDIAQGYIDQCGAFGRKFRQFLRSARTKLGVE